MTIQSGEFWIAMIPYTDGSNSKKRPVFVLWLDGNDTVVVVVTSSFGAKVASSSRVERLACTKCSRRTPVRADSN